MEEWLLCVERYCRVARGTDAPFVYTERANIGVLAGAAWRCGRTALEEFQYPKKNKTKKKWNGRADLYLATDETEEMIEAKFGWASLASPRLVQNRLTKVLNAAVNDATATKAGDKDVSCLAVAFLPTWLPSKRSDELDEKIVSTVAMLEDSDCHAVAWCFPKEFRTFKADSGNNVPGIILAVRNLAYP